MADDDIRGMDDTQQVLPCDTPSNDADLKETTEEDSFFGSYVHGIDAKGRLIIPNSYRLKLGNNFTIGPTADFEAIALYPRKVWLKLISELKQKRNKNIKVQKYIDRFARLSYDGYEADGQGRLLLPQKLRNFCLKEAREVEISGALEYIKIIDSASAEKEDRLTLSEAREMVDLVSSVSLD